MDVLTDVLNIMQLKCSLLSRTEINAPWRFYFSAGPDSMFHIINFGEGFVWVDGEKEPMPVSNGDVIVLPHGHGHNICDKPGSPLIKELQMNHTMHNQYQVFSFDGPKPQTVLLCGIFHFDYPGEYPLIGMLPRVIHIKGEQGRVIPGFSETLQLMARESAEQRPGMSAMLSHLSELLFIQIIRIWVENQTELEQGWLTALKDPQIGLTLANIHQQPGQAWSVGELAQTAGLSRSAFAARFNELVGEAPMRYLNRWRMQKAAYLLRNGLEIGQAAAELGYGSEVVFRKAFKREIGISPGQFKKKY